MKNKLFVVFSWTVIISMMLIILLLGFWLLFPYKIAEYKNVPFPILNENKIVKRGDRVRYLIDACKYTTQIPELIKFFVDGVIFETPKTVGVVPFGCNQVTADAYVPRAIPTGVYSLKMVVKYKVNPIRTIEYTNITEKFTVE